MTKEFQRLVSVSGGTVNSLLTAWNTIPQRRKVSGFVQKRWDEKCCQIVIEGNIAKFSQNEELKAFLLGTGNRVLVEASPLDRIWGIGMAENDNNIENPFFWKGTNFLGFALMEVRDRLSEM